MIMQCNIYRGLTQEIPLKNMNTYTFQPIYKILPLLQNFIETEMKNTGVPLSSSQQMDSGWHVWTSHKIIKENCLDKSHKES